MTLASELPAHAHSAPANDPFAPGLLTRCVPPPRKMVLVRALRVGDFVCATPAFRALRAALPDAEITLVGLPSARGLAGRSPHLDRFEAFPGFPGIADQWFDPRRATAFFCRLQAEQFDLAVQMHGSGVYANPFTLLLGARVTAGYVRPGDAAPLLHAALPFPEHAPAVERALALTRFLGAPTQGEHTEFPLWPADHAAAEALLAGAPRPLVGIHPAATEATKRWPPERFAAAASALRRRHGGTVVVVSGPGERALAGDVASRLGDGCLNLGGRTSLGVLGAVISRLAVLITNDSGPAHVGYALGMPTVTVFGGSDPRTWGPGARAGHRVLAHPVPCRPCNHGRCPIGSPCLHGVTVEQVVEAASDLMQRGPARVTAASDGCGGNVSLSRGA
jgi:ADP-heptose:LPS heptosyltransferase